MSGTTDAAACRMNLILLTHPSIVLGFESREIGECRKNLEEWYDDPREDLSE
jgi:hypothetical protein